MNKVLILLISLSLLAPAASYACAYPDEGNMPLRRAVTKVRMLPETEAWALAMRESGAVVQYALRLDQEKREGGRCYWTVEVRAGEKLWRRYFVTPDGRRVMRDEPPGRG